MPVFLDLLHRHVEGQRESGLRQTGRNPDAHGPGSQFQQRITPIGVQPVEQGRQVDRHAGAGHGGQVRHRFGHGGRSRWPLAPRPQQAGRFRRVPHIVAGQGIEHRIDPLLHQLADDGRFHRREIEPVRQRGERPAAIRIGRFAQVVGNQLELGVAGTGVGQGIDQGGEPLHLNRPRLRSPPGPGRVRGAGSTRTSATAPLHARG